MPPPAELSKAALVLREPLGVPAVERAPPDMSDVSDAAMGGNADNEIGGRMEPLVPDGEAGHDSDAAPGVPVQAMDVEVASFTSPRRAPT